MKINIITTLLVVTLFFVAGCSQLNNRQAGTATGAAVGAGIGQLFGKNTTTTLIGAGVGAIVGFIVGSEFDQYDKRQLVNMYETGEAGKQVVWINPDNGNKYTATPQEAYSTPGSPLCRKAQIEVVLDGQLKTIQSKACRDQFGEWQLKS